MNIFAGSLVTASFSIISPGAVIMVVFLSEQLDASPAIVGLCVALFTLGPVLSLFGAPLFNALRRRRPFWVITTALGRSAYLPLAAAPLLASDESLRVPLLILVLGTGAVAMAVNGFTSVGWWSWMADLIPESMRGRFFGRRMQIVLIVGAIVPPIAGGLLDWWPAHASILLSGMFFIAAVLAVVDPLLFWWIPEPRRDDPPEAISLSKSLAGYLTPLRDKGFRTFLWAVSIRMFAGMLPAPFLALYLRGGTVDGVTVGCGASFTVITISGALGVAAGVLSSNWWGRLADKVGHRPVFLFGTVCYVIQLFYGFMDPGNYIWLLPVLNVLGNLIGVGSGVALSNLLIGVSPREGRDYYVALYTVITSVVMAVSPWIGGVIGGWIPVLPIDMLSGQPATYYHLLLALSFLGMLISVPLTLKIPDARGDASGITMLRMARGGMVRTVHQLGIIAQTDDPLRRARALSSVGAEAAEVGFEEVELALSDPAPQVRREALRALGRIGSERAAALLTWAAHEPDSDTRENAVAAMGQLPAAMSVTVLLGLLGDGDRGVRVAAAAALGRAGDARAYGPLRQCLRDDSDGEVKIAAGRALAYLKDYDSAEDLAWAAVHHTHGLSRSQLTIALAGLFGEQGTFYRLWKRDRSVPGSGFDRIITAASRTSRSILRQCKRSGSPPDEIRLHGRQIKENLARLRSLTELEDWPAALRIMDDLFNAVMSLGGPHADRQGTAYRRCLALLIKTAGTAEAEELIGDGVTLAAAYGLHHYLLALRRARRDAERG